MIRGYFWKLGEVLTWEGPMNAEQFREPCGGVHLQMLPCLDLTGRNEAQRTGYYDGHGWKHTPIEDFPKDFRTALLLLGVS